MTRRDFLWQASVVSPGLPLLAPVARGQSNRPPNVIFILADDLGWGDLQCYGHPHIQTPNLDKLAQQGSLFTQFYVNSAVCSPSRTGFMTSLFPARLGIHGHIADEDANRNRGMPNFVDPAVPTLTQLFKKAGYRVGHFGKWHLGHGEGAPGPEAYGVDDHRTLVSNGPTWPHADYYWAELTARIVDESIQFIEESGDQPFYLNVWTLLPHAVLNPTHEQMEPYRRFGPNRPGILPYKGAMQIYYASVTDLDHQVGRLLDRLRDLNLERDTVVLFSSDNGPEDIHAWNASHSGVGSPGPFRGRKRSIYEGGIRTPLIARWPGRVPAGRIDHDSVLSGVDFLPTICKWGEIELPADLKADGEDVTDILTGESRHRKGPLFWEWRFRILGEVRNRSPMLAMRDGDWKLLMNPDGSRTELYDIVKDPREQTNLAQARPEIVRHMSVDLLKWQRTLPEGPTDAEAGNDDYPWPGR